MYQHMYDETSEQYDVAWDAALHEQDASSLPPPPLEDLSHDTDTTETPEVETILQDY